MLLTRLKHDTRELHEQVEQTLHLFDSQPTRDEYGELLQKFYGFYEPVEQRLAQLDWQAAGFDWTARRKTQLLEQDLAAMGLSREAMAALPRCETLPPLETVAQAVGCLYVLEGSTLGGQIITRRVRSLPGPELPTAFFRSYGESVGVMWKQFGAFATDYAAQHQADDAIVESARKTFEAMKTWLSEQGKSR